MVKVLPHQLPDDKTMGRLGKEELETFVPRVQQVMRQAPVRVIGGNMDVQGKLVSLFEPSTEIIRRRKAKQPTEFGKMIKVQEAESQIITDYEVWHRKKLQQSRWFRKGQKWRTGCEGRISVLKSRHGLNRCLYKA